MFLALKPKRETSRTVVDRDTLIRAYRVVTHSH